MISRDGIVRTLTAIVGLFLAGFGIWAFIDPASFFEQIATYPPYNEHLLHDIGAFQIGLGFVLLVSLAWSDALLVALAGGSIGSVMHLLAHAVDWDTGGRNTDPIAVGIVALAAIVAFLLRYEKVERTPRP